MDNWIFLIIGLILAYLLEFTRPWVKSYFEKSSLSLRQRRIYVLVSRYRRLKRFREEPADFILEVLQYLAYGVMFLLLLAGIASISIIGRIDGTIEKTILRTRMDSVFLSVMMYFPVYVLWVMTRNLRTVLDFDKFREETLQKLKKLGGNPEDLDKEETAGG